VRSGILFHFIQTHRKIHAISTLQKTNGVEVSEISLPSIPVRPQTRTTPFSNQKLDVLVFIIGFDLDYSSANDVLHNFHRIAIYDSNRSLGNDDEVA
jgi:hypothetical protein